MTASTSAIPTTSTVAVLEEYGRPLVHPYFYKALECIRNRRDEYPFADIVTTHFSLEQVNEALASMASGAEIKPVIDNRSRGSA